MKKITVIIFCLMALYTQAQNTFPATGNVGIGTTAPSATLQVGGGSGNLHFGSTGILLKPSIIGDRALMELHSPDGKNRLILQSVSGTSYLSSLDAKPLLLQSSGGNVGIGGHIDPKAQLDVYNNAILGSSAGATTEIAKFGGLSASYNYSQLKIQLYRYTTGTDWFSASTRLQAMTNATNQGYIEFNPKGGPYGLALGTMNGEAIMINSSNNVGIGTSTPSEALDVLGNIKTGGSITIGSNGGRYTNGSIFADGNWGMIFRASTSSPLSANFMWANAASKELMRIGTNGNVGIGTTNPTQKLSVNGTIQAKEILVNTGWSDFVFDSNYKLRSLTEVEQFVKNNKHLPEIPSQKEVEKNGVQLGDISSKLLMKIEELTLYMIEMKKENEKQQKEIEKQKGINIKLENEIKKLQNK